MGPSNAKKLLMNDNNYTTPQDSYFGYIAKRKLTAGEVEKENEVIENLKIHNFFPEAKLLESIEEYVQGAEDEDVFEMAKRKGVALKDLKEIEMDSTDIEKMTIFK